MIAVVLSSHGHFSQAILKSCEMICGSRDNVAAVTFDVGESADTLVDKYRAVLKMLDLRDGVIFMTDLFAGSPYNAACRLSLETGNAAIVAGLNMPMLLEILSSPSLTLEEAKQVAQRAGKEGVRAFEPISAEDRDKEEL
ncbi:PTS sugar transporter subunit IIA [Acetonema longum]|uniref:PTS system mannose/fructose/sorbose family IIA subunit n=1 Tax=Acetonema longum DSM 6540 TaxID=1009370 RepID=F7NDA8_9FIRM|nr:PTS sugar transporter subunit IIA [Acetonema longum]EGO65940.1 PTS system mannose/fructose/sorbose family IIA subunit [Acetonema longum DSM 6540]